MATTFNVFNLGTGPIIDPTEGNQLSENASGLVGLTFGSVGNPLYGAAQSFSPGTTGFGSGSATAYDSNNTGTNDTFRINGGANQTMDGVTLYAATITYANGATASIGAIVIQDTAGNLYLVPQLTQNAAQTAMEAGAIRSLTINSVTTNNADLASDRLVGNYILPNGAVDGTGGNDAIGTGFIDTQGDAVDGWDGNNDLIYGGAGNDTINGNAGNDSIYGGSGTDLMYGGAADDQIFGGAGNDTGYGGAGNDTLGSFSATEGAGNDQLYGDAGNDVLFIGVGADTVYGGDDQDTIYAIGSDTNQVVFGGEGGTDRDTLSWVNETDSADAVNVVYTANEAGVGTSRGHTVTFSQIEALTTSQVNDVVNASVTTNGVYVSLEAGNDSLIGGSGNDTVFGGSGADTLLGGAGSDLLYGGTGNDVLTGGAGNDVFYYVPGDGNDTITDFNSGNTGALNDGNRANNDFIDLTAYYDSLSELRADFLDDGVLNQSNALNTFGQTVNYADNATMGGSLSFTGATRKSFTSDNTGIVCFCEGSAILTARGEVLIEALRIGDMVQTLDNGLQPIRWIGRRVLTSVELESDARLYPVHIGEGVLGNRRKLLVSGQHGVLWGADHFVRAKHLLGLVDGVRVAHGKKRVVYYHLMFDAHQVIFAEGIGTESFYPGPTAWDVIGRAARTEIATILPGLAAALSDPSQLLACYGETARRFLTAGDLRRMGKGSPLGNGHGRCGKGKKLAA
jgi:Ca2+-binding RTX toxin-like protein